MKHGGWLIKDLPYGCGGEDSNFTIDILWMSLKLAML
jgi:hypothetical protein